MKHEQWNPQCSHLHSMPQQEHLLEVGDLEHEGRSRPSGSATVLYFWLLSPLATSPCQQSRATAVYAPKRRIDRACSKVEQHSIDRIVAENMCEITNMPQGDGFGSQFQQILGTLAFAQASGRRFCLSPIQAMEHNYDRRPTFLKKVHELMSLEDIVPTIPLRSNISIPTMPEFFLPLTVRNIYGRLENQSIHPNLYLNARISLGDQTFLPLFHAIRHRILCKVRRSPQPQLHAVVHLRRPGPNREHPNPNRYPSIDAICGAMREVLAKYPNITFHVHSETSRLPINPSTTDGQQVVQDKHVRQSNTSSRHHQQINDLHDPEAFSATHECSTAEAHASNLEEDVRIMLGGDDRIKLHLNEPLSKVYTDMLAADVLIMSPSSLSYTAALLSKGDIWAPATFWHLPQPHWHLYLPHRQSSFVSTIKELLWPHSNKCLSNSARPMPKPQHTYGRSCYHTGRCVEGLGPTPEGLQVMRWISENVVRPTQG